jgi:ankyrin repeat protein
MPIPSTAFGATYTAPDNTTTTAFTTSVATSFLDLPLHLQMLVFAHTSAPLTTCKAAAAVRQDPLLLATWFWKHQSYSWNIKAAADAKQWRIVPLLVEMIKKRWSASEWEGDLELAYVLQMAAEAGRLEIVQHCLKAGAWEKDLWGGVIRGFDCQCDPRRDFVPAIFCECGAWDGLPYDEDVPSLLQMGHPLITAARGGHAGVCSVLLQQGIHPSVARGAVVQAAGKGHLAVLQVLLAEGPPGMAGSDVECDEDSWNNPMFIAAEQGHTAVVRCFLDQGADVYNANNTPWLGLSKFGSCLVAAAAGGCPELLQMLLDDCGMPLQPDWADVLRTAASKGHVQAVRVLLTAAATTVEGTIREGNTQSLGQGQGEAGQQEVARALCSSAEISDQQQQEQQPEQPQHHQRQSVLPAWAGVADALWGAVVPGHTEVIRLLLPYLNPQQPTDKECMCDVLTQAAVRGHTDIITLMLQHGTPVNGKYDSIDFSLKGWYAHSCTPLGFALSQRQWAAAELLISAGARVSEHSLYSAGEHGAPAHIFTALFEKGARDFSNDAIYMAAKAGHKVALEQLLGIDAESVGSEVIVDRFGKAFSAVRHIQLHQFQAAALSQLESSARLQDRCLQVAEPDIVVYLCSLIDEYVANSTSPNAATLRQQILNTALADAVSTANLQHIELSKDSSLMPQQQAYPSGSAQAEQEQGEQGVSPAKAEAGASGGKARGELPGWQGLIMGVTICVTMGRV